MENQRVMALPRGKLVAEQLNGMVLAEDMIHIGMVSKPKNKGYKGRRNMPE